MAYPIYGSTAPKIIWEFLGKIENVSKSLNEGFINNVKNDTEKFGYVLTTMAMFSGDGALVTQKKNGKYRI